MKQTINWTGYVVGVVILVDIMIVMFTMLQIGNGMYTPHISFWDQQIQLVASIMK
jgi:hypothetical protein